MVFFCRCWADIQLQWVPLNGIMDNKINWIIESLLGAFSQSHQLENWLMVSFTFWDQALSGPK